jgi:glutamate formiminotransferase
VAYNINLATSDLTLARQIARRIRESSGGLPAVQALGMATADASVVQVSMNLLDTSRSPLHVVFETVERLAAAEGVTVVESEIVGLLPLDVLIATTRARIKARELGSAQIIEARLLQARSTAPPPRPSSGQAGT